MSASIKRVLRCRTLEKERKHFEKLQETSYRKSVNDDEVPIKMKHVRNLILGTHVDKNAELFWRNVSLLPPFSTEVMAWKFCCTFHRIIRDGHPHVLQGAPNHIHKLKDIGTHFSHLHEGYGRLIKCYCELLVTKITFHQRYPKVPGSLQLTPEELKAAAENDANDYYELAAGMLEYMECILNLNEVVFLSMDPISANSMTRAVHCRLASLIPCIQDSSCLYGYIVRIMLDLHKVLPIDMLKGHSTRFCKQFANLQQFYKNTRNLQYFKGLIQVPTLPQNAPEFLCS